MNEITEFVFKRLVDRLADSDDFVVDDAQDEHSFVYYDSDGCAFYRVTLTPAKVTVSG